MEETAHTLTVLWQTLYGRGLVNRMEAAYIVFSSKDERLIHILKFFYIINDIIISRFFSLLYTEKRNSLYLVNIGQRNYLVINIILIVIIKRLVILLRIFYNNY